MVTLKRIKYIFLSIILLTNFLNLKASTSLMQNTYNVSTFKNTQKLTKKSFDDIQKLGDKLVNLLEKIKTTLTTIDFNNLSDCLSTSQLKTIILKHYRNCLDWNEIFTLNKISLDSNKIATLGGYIAIAILPETFKVMLENKKIVKPILTETEKTFNKQIDLYINKINTIINEAKKDYNLIPNKNDQDFITKIINGKTYINIKNSTTYQKICEIINELKNTIPHNLQTLIDSVKEFYQTHLYC
ncbi:hypothetical protein GF322_01280 [Candidatus Dependentiae bacterium]|nr:hypothetical protein [Candidatus Dependentiae bacterium]